MTFQTPFHLQRCRLIGDRHFIYLAVTSRTTDTFCNMNAVVEVGVIREVVNANPFNWFAGSEAGTHWLEIRTLGPDLLVTVHADIG